MLAHYAALQAQAFINCNRNFLLGPKITLRRLNRGMTKQEFNLFQIAAVLAAELRASPAQIVSAEVFDPNLLCRLLDNRGGC